MLVKPSGFSIHPSIYSLSQCRQTPQPSINLCVGVCWQVDHCYIVTSWDKLESYGSFGPKVENTQIHPETQSALKHTCGQSDWLPRRLETARYLICIYQPIDALWSAYTNHKLKSDDALLLCIIKAHAMLGKTLFFTYLYSCLICHQK